MSDKFTSPLFHYPADRAKIIGTLSSQKVQAFEKWNDFYHIRTWMGDAWVRSDYVKSEQPNHE